MNFDQVKKFLKDGYESNGFDVVAEPIDGETEMRYPAAETFDITLKISNDDIEDYSKLMSARGEFVPIGKTGMANTNFRESLLIPLDSTINTQDIDDLFFKLNSDSEIYVEIDTVSLVFSNYFRFDPGYMNLCLDRLFSFPPKLRKDSAKKTIDVRNTFARPLSIRVYHIGAQSTDEAIKISTALIEGALFTLAYDIGIPLMLAENYPSSRYDTLRKVKANNHKVHKIILPDSNFRHDLVRYYQAGISSPIAIQQFLSFYQILELFFQDVNHVGVYDDLYHMLRSEGFRPDNSSLSQIVNLVESHKRELGTADLLEQLIRQHVNTDEIKKFILRNSGTAEETIHTLAKRIITTRDAIMMAGVNGVPPGDSSVARDVPLMKFLAEQVILATKA